MYKQIAISFSIALLTLVLSPSSVFAAKPTTKPTSTPLGNDVSYPQCGAKLPTNHAFGIVGVNKGLATTINPCLASQLTWASKAVGGTDQEYVQLYVNTANPGGLGTVSWPSNNIDTSNNTSPNPHGTCDNSDSLACAWQYGWNRAAEDVVDRFAPAVAITDLDPDASKYVWWLDVETENTWKTGGTAFDYQSNVAVLEGMTEYFKTHGIRVGLYSTAYQWNQIVGQAVSSDSNLNNLPNWRPGGASLATARDACDARPLTAGGSVILTQYVSKNLDYDYVCS